MSKIYADFANNLFLETGYFLQQQPTTNNQPFAFFNLLSARCGVYTTWKNVQKRNLKWVKLKL